MNDLPERIWAWGLLDFKGEGQWREAPYRYGTEYVRVDLIVAKDAEIARLKAELGEYTTRLCLSCGRRLHASHERIEAPEGCPTPEVCTVDLTAGEAWDHWRKIAHDQSSEIARLTRERDAAAAAALERAAGGLWPAILAAEGNGEIAREAALTFAVEAIRDIPRDTSALTAMLADAEARGRAQGEDVALERAAGALQFRAEHWEHGCDPRYCRCDLDREQWLIASDEVRSFIRDGSALDAVVAEAEARGMRAAADMLAPSANSRGGLWANRLARRREAILRAALAKLDGGEPRVQHTKRGSTYRVVGEGKVQTDTPLTDNAEVVVYRGEKDGLIWVRPVAEFNDPARFTKIGDEGMNEAQFLLSIGFKPPKRVQPAIPAPAIVSWSPFDRNWCHDSEADGWVPIKRKDEP